MRNPVGRIWNTPPEKALPVDASHSAAIKDSHSRSAALGLTRIECPDFARVLAGDLNVARERNRRLSTHAAPVMEMLFDQITGTESMIVLTDAQGTVLHAVGDDTFLERANKVALSPGANWAEQSKGTNAIGTALFEERPTLVHADEHFMHANSFLTCSAAPIFDPRGSVLGILDVTGDHRSYHRHTMGLVRMSARMIENHWLGDACADRLRLHFHSRTEFIGTLLEGILVVGGDGRIVGANQSALDQLGLTGTALRGQTIESLLGTTPAKVIEHFRRPMPMPMELALGDGRVFHFSARFHWTPRQMPAASLRPAAAAVAAAAAEPARAAPQAGAAAPAAPVAASGAALAALATGDARADAVVAKLQRVIDRDVALLFYGEGGTGRLALARAAHAASRRAARAFVVVPCAALPEPLLDAELFGAGEARPGALERAAGGTLYLDDVDALTPLTQIRLVAALAARRDDGRPRHDLLLASATRIELREAVAAHRFREDLYVHLNGLALRVPPLRERSDLETIAARLLARDAPERPATITAPALALLRRHAWPGNVRQFASVLRTAALLSGEGREIGVEQLPEDFAAAEAAPAAPAAPATTNAAADAPTTLEAAEVELIRRAVDEAGGNISVAAKRLGIARNTVYRKLRWKR